MAGADWGSAYLLADLYRKMGLQEANEVDDDTEGYPRLSVAQRKIIARLSSIFPNAFYQAPALLTMATDRKTASFGSDGNGNAQVPLGNVQIATSLNAFSGDPFVGLEVDRDFYEEGDVIRCTGNRAFARPLYGRWVPTAPDITSTVAPIIKPAHVRELISRQAAIDWAEEGGLKQHIATTQRLAMEGEPGRPGEIAIYLHMYRKRYKNGGGLYNPAQWYLAAPDLGSGV